MLSPQNSLRRKIKEKLWLWPPIVVFGTIGFIVFIFLSDSFYTNRKLNNLRAKEPTTKIEMKVVSSNGVKNIVMVNRELLDSIDAAFKTAEEKDIRIGGIFEIWAYVSVYKGKKKINLFIEHSVYNGWMIEVGNKTLTSEYLFALVRLCAKK